MWRDFMLEPFIISKSIFNIAERGVFSAYFYESFIFWVSPLIGVNEAWTSTPTNVKVTAVNIANSRRMKEKYDRND